MNSFRGAMNAGVVEIEDVDIWSKLLSSDGERGISQCCGAKVIIRIMDGVKWFECLACGKECEITV